MNCPKDNLGLSLDRTPSAERGYILLVLALFLAVIAMGLMRALPSALVETQREREEELIFRGEQYRRAIQAYVRKFGRYPNSLEDLENTNGVRFLRQRYLDPMKKRNADQDTLTEQAAAWQRSDERAPAEAGEWRLIHIGPGGTFPDARTSITPPAQNPLAPPGGLGLPPSPGMPGGSRGPSSPSSAGGPASPQSQFEARPSPFGGGPAGRPAAPQSQFGAVPSPFGGGQAGRPAAPQSQFGAVPSPFGAPATPGLSGPAPGTTPEAGPRSPQLPDAFRPSADPTVNPALQPRAAQTAAQQAGSPVFGAGGIAGVASHNPDESIKVVNGYTQYDQWEFIYDVRADQIGMAAIARASGALAQPVAQPTAQPGAPGRGAVPGQPGFPGIPGVPGMPPPGVMTAQPPAVPGGAPTPFPFPGSQPPGIRPGFPSFPGSTVPGSQPSATQPAPSPFDPRPFPGSSGFQSPRPGQSPSPFAPRPSPGFQQPGTQPGQSPFPSQPLPGSQQPGVQPGQPPFPPSPIPGFPPNPRRR